MSSTPPSVHTPPTSFRPGRSSHSNDCLMDPPVKMPLKHCKSRGSTCWVNMLRAYSPNSWSVLRYEIWWNMPSCTIPKQPSIIFFPRDHSFFWPFSAIHRHFSSWINQSQTWILMGIASKKLTKFRLPSKIGYTKLQSAFFFRSSIYRPSSF